MPYIADANGNAIYVAADDPRLATSTIAGQASSYTGVPVADTETDPALAAIEAQLVMLNQQFAAQAQANATQNTAADRNFFTEAKLLYPWLSDGLAQTFAEAWAEFGDPALALSRTRQSNEYDQMFPGIKRPDGSFRMTEDQYFATRDFYALKLLDYGVNPELFEEKFTSLIEGEVSPDEFSFRVDAAANRVFNNIDAVRSEYARLNGIEASDAAILASFLDPDVGEQILNRQVDVAQVSAEASSRGFSLSLQDATRFTNLGLDQGSARSFFSAAATQLPTLSALASRFRSGQITLSDFTRAQLEGSPMERLRMNRLFQAEAASFNQVGIAATSQLGVSGLNRA